MAYNYTCTKCGRKANKPACEKPTGNLGKWHCDRCGKTTVKREK